MQMLQYDFSTSTRFSVRSTANACPLPGPGPQLPVEPLIKLVADSSAQQQQDIEGLGASQLLKYKIS